MFSDEATETDILVASEIKILIESDTTEPWSVLEAELSPLLSCEISDTAIATGEATEFTSSSTDGAGLVVSSI